MAMPNTESQSRANSKGDYRKSILLRLPIDIVPLLENEARVSRVSVNKLLVDLVVSGLWTRAAGRVE